MVWVKSGDAVHEFKEATNWEVGDGLRILDGDGKCLAHFFCADWVRFANEDTTFLQDNALTKRSHSRAEPWMRGQDAILYDTEVAMANREISADVTSQLAAKISQLLFDRLRPHLESALEEAFSTDGKETTVKWR